MKKYLTCVSYYPEPHLKIKVSLIDVHNTNLKQNHLDKYTILILK